MALISLWRWRAPTAIATCSVFLVSLLSPISAAAQEAGDPPTYVSADELEVADVAIADEAQPVDTTAEPVEEKRESAAHGVELADENSLDVSKADLRANQNLNVSPNLVEHPGTETIGLPSGEDKSGVTSKSISVPKGSGTIKGMGESFSAQLSTGIATYSVPFALPAARGGAQPSLGLSYSSSGGFGTAGVGWNLGVPFIARQTDRGLPRYNEDADRDGYVDEFNPDFDRFVFNGGQELVPICRVDGGSCTGAQDGEIMPRWADGYLYFRPRVEGSFLRFFWSPNGETWRVQSKSGVTMELGVPLDSRGYEGGLERNPSPKRHHEIYRWHLTRQYDTWGDANPAGGNPQPNNAVYYLYEHDGGSAYLTDIYDTSPASDPTSLTFSDFAHHTKVHWEERTDPTSSYRSGWRMEQNWRVARVDVTSASWGQVGDLSLVRRYELSYDSEWHQSLLQSVKVVGRCKPNADGSFPSVPEVDNAIPADFADQCPNGVDELPPMTFGYSHVPGTPTLPGYEAINGEVRRLDASPPHSVDEAYSDLFDVNADGLPDLLVTAPGLYNSGHAWFQNAAGGQLESFGDAQQLGVYGVLGAGAGDITFKNLNVRSLDADGDGRTDLVHMPKFKTYAVYDVSPDGIVGRKIETASKQNVKIDFASDGPDVQVMDANFDGLVDVVVSTGLEYQTFLSMGRLPHGDGQFGKGKWLDKELSDIQTEPITTCVPWSGQPVRFSDPDTKLSDMNGDGIVDIVRLRRGQIQYWPGRGNGFWGTGDRDDCEAKSFGQDRHIEMADSPYYSDIQGTSMRLDDVNGDGLTDLVQVRFQEVDVWLNVDGRGWTERHIIEGTPASPSFAQRVRLVDVDGSGTRDILWGNADRYEYIDLQAGTRPWILTSVQNGLGKTTTLEYSTSVDEMLAAEAAGTPWESRVPMVLHLVKRMTETDNLDVASLGARTYVTEYSYSDPVYDGQQREFRGFREATSKRIGDANSPTHLSHSKFLLGECQDDPETPYDDCSPAYRWKDNPREALKGLPYVSETFDEGGIYLSTAHTQYTLRPLYEGLDGRSVVHAFASKNRSYLYDTANPSAFSDSPVDLPTIVDEFPDAPVEEQRTITQRASSGTAVTESESFVDEFGNRTQADAHGCVSGSGCPQIDETLTSLTQPAVVDPDVTGWLWRTTQSSVLGSNGEAAHGERGKTITTYNEEGAPTHTEAVLSGTEALDRFHASAGATAPTPGDASADSTIVLSTTTYDDFGNATRSTAPNNRCGDVIYESVYAQLPLQDQAYPSGCAVDPQTPPADTLTTAATFDRGFGLVTAVVDMQGQSTLARYDGLGRITELVKPDSVASNLSDLPPPSVKISYLLPNETGGNYSLIHTQAQDSDDIRPNGDDTAGPEHYIHSYAYVDGFGRTLITLSEADPDPTLGDGHDWVASAFLEYDTKGAVRRKHLEFFWDGSGDEFPLTSQPTTPYGRQRYDAFGRALETYDLDGTVTLRTRYHALSTDAWDAADLEPGPHQGTHATAIKDGHGRALKAIERFRDGTTVVERTTTTQYLPTGEPEVITRSNGTDSVVRWMRYDTLGRMVLNVEPNTSVGFDDDHTVDASGIKAWRYAYNNNGELVGTSDARGCGVNFAYDYVGRLLAEDYSPCEAHHANYTAPSGTDPATATGVEVLYVYDAAPTANQPTDAFIDGNTFGWSSLGSLGMQDSFLKGRLVAVFDRAKQTWSAYDGRGRGFGTFVSIAKSAEDPDNALNNRYSARWYVEGAGFDAADRIFSTSTGVRSEKLRGADGETKIDHQYSARGVIKEVGGSYGALVQKIKRRADGLHTEIQYGDIAGTTTAFVYDERRRVRTVQTYRGPPPGGQWDPAYPDYDPDPAPSGPPTTFQLLLQDDEFTYDVVGNPVEVRDWRNPNEWPAGAKPVHKKIQYDDLYRVSRVDYEYALGDDAVVEPGAADSWTDPFDHEENATSLDPRLAHPAPRQVFDKRIKSQSFEYDWLGNTRKTDDDAKGFYDRSLGTITNGPTGGAAYQLQTAEQPSGDHRGKLQAEYDGAGNLTEMRLNREGTCRPTDLCAQVYRYDWDEVGRLSRAQRWDYNNGLDVDQPASPSGLADVDLRYAYDAGDMRVIKRAEDTASNESITLYIFAALELRRTTFDTSAQDYVLDEETEVTYLFANGVRLARVVWEPQNKGEPFIGTYDIEGKQHVFFELGDHLGSASVVLDQATSELVERSTYQAYGGAESDYRPERWKGFREDYRFTGKEEDVEVGLQYFGFRYYAPLLGRWASADPLTVHDQDADPNAYAYVGGSALAEIDPLGLTIPQPKWDPLSAAVSWLSSKADKHRAKASQAVKDGDYAAAAGHVIVSTYATNAAITTFLSPYAVDFAAVAMGTSGGPKSTPPKVGGGAKVSAGTKAPSGGGSPKSPATKGTSTSPSTTAGPGAPHTGQGSSAGTTPPSTATQPGKQTPSGTATATPARATPKKAPNLKWGNPKSKPTYGHTFLDHGQKKTHVQLADKARNQKVQQGRWTNDVEAAEFIAQHAQGKKPGEYNVPLTGTKGEAVQVNGDVEVADMARIVVRKDGSVKTSFPFSSKHPSHKPAAGKPAAAPPQPKKKK